MKKKLDIGCGNNLKEGYIGVDCQDLPNIDIVCDAWEINKFFANSSIDEIYCRHSLEHYTFAQGVQALAAWYKILKPGSEMHLIVPDLDYHLKQFADKTNWHKTSDWKFNDITNLEHALGSLFGWQSNDFDIHKSGYNFELLKIKLETAGFTDITRRAMEPWHLYIVCKKGEK